VDGDNSASELQAFAASPIEVESSSGETEVRAVPVGVADVVDANAPGAAVPSTIPAATGDSSPNSDRSIESAPTGVDVGGGSEELAPDALPSAGTGIDLGSSLGIGQLLAMVMAVASAFAAWRSRVA
jgi:hypothetical protein